MKRTSRFLLPAVSGLAVATAILAGLLFTSVPARAQVELHFDLGNAPPAPTLVFRTRPVERLYPGERVYVVTDPAVGDYDFFRYGSSYYLFNNGYWYRAPGWKSRFVVVHPSRVPTRIYQLPPERWKHRPNVPPGLAKKRYGMPPGQLKKQAKEHGEHGEHGKPDRH